MPTDPKAGRAAVARLAGEPHRRYNPLKDEWVLVSAGRTRRPWLGAQEPDHVRAGMTFDPDCYLCPGNVRANGNVNPRYDETYVFTNDFAALRPDTSIESIDDGLLRAEGERGSCRVVCFSPRHDLSLGRMEADAVRRVVDVWAEQTAELGAEYRWVRAAGRWRSRGRITAGAPGIDRAAAVARLCGPGIGRPARHRRE